MPTEITLVPFVTHEPLIAIVQTEHYAIRTHEAVAHLLFLTVLHPVLPRHYSTVTGHSLCLDNSPVCMVPLHFACCYCVCSCPMSLQLPTLPQ